MMDCTSLCLLAVSLGLPHPHNVQRCDYCMDIRALSDNCKTNLIECTRLSPDEIIYCLTIDELSWGSHLNRQVRCLSHRDFQMPPSTVLKVQSLGLCIDQNKRHMEHCECPTCVPMMTTTDTLESSFEEIQQTKSNVPLANVQKNLTVVAEERKTKDPISNKSRLEWNKEEPNNLSYQNISFIDNTMSLASYCQFTSILIFFIALLSSLSM